MKKWLFAIIPILILVFAFLRPRIQSGSDPVLARKDALLVQQASLPEDEAPLRTASEQQSVVVRKIIHSGEVTVQIKRYEPFFQALQKRVELMGGFIANIQSQRSGASVSSASLTLRVPPAQLQTMVSWLREQGLLSQERIQAEDISEQYYDLKSRLENAKRFETRLLEMLKTQTGNLQDLILVEGKLNEVREQIEQMEGKMRYYDALTDLATLTVQVQVESVYVPPASPTFAHRIAVAWHNSIAGLFETGQACAVIIVAITPWILPILLAAIAAKFAFRNVWRFLKKRNARELKSAPNNAG